MPAAFDQYASDYETQLNRGLALAGEGKDYFAEGRIRWLSRRLRQHGAAAGSALDFGCGTGTSSPLLLRTLRLTSVLGVDVSADSLEVARREAGSNNITFQHRTESLRSATFDLAFCNGVFHHIPLADRPGEMAWIHGALKPGGYFALWENNPWNPGTRWVMSRIPFDRDAILVWPREARRLLREAGFEIVATDFCFIFPRMLAALRPIEPLACKLPCGAQYLVLGRKAA